MPDTLSTRTLAAVVAGTLVASTPGCAHRKVSNQDVAVTIVGVAALVGLVLIFAAARCDELTERCDREER